MQKFRFLILVLVSLLLGLTTLSPVYAQEEVLISKVASSDNASLGDNITYTYVVTNNSADNVTGLNLIDDKIGEIDMPDQLLAGESITVMAHHFVSLNDYSSNATQLVNTATLTSSENITATAIETVELNPYDANLQVTKELPKKLIKILQCLVK